MSVNGAVVSLGSRALARQFTLFSASPAWYGRRSRKSVVGMPMVALSSHTEDQDFARGRQVGFTDYVGKLDRDGLLQTLSETIPAS